MSPVFALGRKIALAIGLQEPERITAVNETEQTRITHLLGESAHRFSNGRRDFVTML
jgi:hypothetical protein